MCVCADMASLTDFQNASRAFKRSKHAPTGEFQSRADCLNFMRSNPLPASKADLDPTALYTVHGMADVFEQYPDTMAIPLVSRKTIHFMSQLVELQRPWALHGDGKHKLHFGTWMLITFGTHMLRWDAHNRVFSHAFCPLLYLWARDHESVEVVKFGMDAMQMACMHFFNTRLAPAVCISDFSNGLRSGMRCIAGEDEAAPLHFGDWAHLSFHYQQSRMLKKSNPHFGGLYFLMQGIHVAHSTEMKDMLVGKTRSVIQDWLDHDDNLSLKDCKDLKEFVKQYLQPPWDTWSIGAFDSVMSDECLDLPLILPSNQCQESWHKQLVLLLGKSKMRQSHEVVLNQTLPKVLLSDQLKLPDTLLDTPTHVVPAMVKKAIRYLEAATKHLRQYQGNYYCLRHKSDFKGISRTLTKSYRACVNGTPNEMSTFKRYDDALTREEELHALMSVCQSMHSLYPAAQDDDLAGQVIVHKLNPSGLICTCKGFRHCAVCSHCIACTAFFVEDAYDIEHLRSLLASMENKKRKNRRPKGARAAQRIQPREDSSDEEEEVEWPVHDLWGQ